ncbi:hypothetical protein NESM_000692400 [Novymonas esmeraldas]|uniref:Uncharacterized protein n=1 Tax=Novymonas esmeraldas TaxID=1808958 RepID=A0AAW0ETT0_9TRYP
MSSARYCRSDSSSWSAMARGAVDAATDTAALTDTHVEAAGVSADAMATEDRCHAEASALLSAAGTSEFLVRGGDDDLQSNSSADSWVEVLLESPRASSPTQHEPTVDEAAGAQTSALLATAPAEAEEEAPSVTDDDAAVPHSATRDASSATPAAAEEVDVSQLIHFLMGTSPAAVAQDPADAAAVEVPATPRPTDFTVAETSSDGDDLISVADDPMERRETVNVDPESDTSASARWCATHAAPPVGVTAVLRRRVVEEDLMRTERGQSDLTADERLAVLRALFGDVGNAPISAERFREVMVPYQRHCDCLGASYGFHNRSCRFYAEFPVSL